MPKDEDLSPRDKANQPRRVVGPVRVRTSITSNQDGRKLQKGIRHEDTPSSTDLQAANNGKPSRGLRNTLEEYNAKKRARESNRRASGLRRTPEERADKRESLKQRMASNPNAHKEEEEETIEVPPQENQPPEVVFEITNSECQPEHSYHLTPAQDTPEETEEPVSVDCELIDPAEEKSWFARHKKIVISAACVLLSLVVAVAVIVPLLTSESDNNASPDGSPNMVVNQNLIPGLPNNTWASMSDLKSPQFQAYSWIVQDPNLNQYERWQLQQRFALAVFYHAMNGPSWNDHRWLDYDANECEWLKDPITCDFNGHVLLLNVTSQRGFKGELPPELNLLTKLEGLDFSNNLIGGNLSTLFGSQFAHPRLENLRCQNCRLGGSFPIEITDMVNLQSLVLNNNEISGVVPVEIGNLSLIVWEMMNNDLTGAIPTSIATAKSLENLKLSGNQLGSLPTEIGLLSKLQVLDLSENAISHSIPSEIGSLNGLSLLALSRNSFVGPIPSELGLLTDLSHIFLYRNALDGTIPEQLSCLRELVYYDISDNHLSGSLPSFFGNLTGMQMLDLVDNNLTGTIPSELGLLRKLHTLLLRDNHLSGTVPSKLSQLPALKFFDVRGNSGLLCENEECYHWED